MAEPTIVYELDFHFSNGERVQCEVTEGRDVIQDITHCTHCGRAAMTKITVNTSPDYTRTLTIHTDKLDAVDSTKHVVQPERGNPRNGDTILELS